MNVGVLFTVFNLVKGFGLWNDIIFKIIILTGEKMVVILKYLGFLCGKVRFLFLGF